MKPRRNSVKLLTAALSATLCCVGCSDDTKTSALPNPPLQIEPNQAVGSVRAGMSAKDVVSQLGEPQRRTANALEYTRLGFAVMPGRDGIVQVVMCGDVTGLGGPLVEAFSGRTKEGVGMKSTRDDVLKAYGLPSSSEKLPGNTESLRYDSLGITFTLEAGKVYHMIVRLQPAPEAPSSIAIEPVTEGNQK